MADNSDNQAALLNCFEVIRRDGPVTWFIIHCARCVIYQPLFVYTLYKHYRSLPLINFVLLIGWSLESIFFIVAYIVYEFNMSGWALIFPLVLEDVLFILFALKLFD